MKKEQVPRLKLRFWNGLKSGTKYIIISSYFLDFFLKKPFPAVSGKG